MPEQALPLDAAAELVGEWWLPADPNVTGSGRLIYVPNEPLRLQLVSFADVLGPTDPVPLARAFASLSRPARLRAATGAPLRAPPRHRRKRRQGRRPRAAPVTSRSQRLGIYWTPRPKELQSGRPDLNRGPLVPQTTSAVGRRVVPR